MFMKAKMETVSGQIKIYLSFVILYNMNFLINSDALATLHTHAIIHMSGECYGFNPNP